MGYTYTPTYYSGLQDTIASLCKSILPSFRVGRRLTADQAASRRHAEQLKWQQESFHRILHLAALHREGIVPASDVAAFRGPMLAALVAPPQHHPEQPAVLRDKLLFLQELLYAKCVSAAEYNASKAPLVQRLAALGVVVDCPDAEVSAEEWSEIDLRDPTPPPTAAAAADKPKHKAAFITPWKSRSKKDQDASSAPRPPLGPVDQNASVLMVAESSPSERVGKPDKGKRRHLTAMFHGGGGNGAENKEPAAGEEGADQKETLKGKKKSSWGFDGIKKWKKAGGCSSSEAAITVEQLERAPPRSSYNECRLEASPVAAASGPDAKRAKTHTATGDGSVSELLRDKVLVENTKKELSRIQAELSSTNPNLSFSDKQIEAISTKLPVDKADLKPFFPKAWCDQHGDGVIIVAKKEFKEHVVEMEKRRDTDITGCKGWATFEDDDLDDNFNPRASSQHQSDSVVKGKKVNESLTNSFTNPFYSVKNPFLDTNYN
ncbi:hypothetical protein U9M48_015136 [Paspalum notatum var. saurae]|uniref:Uncharacterized protein n=1 Tax=Paspalum notatum var. saurae TaxID=547442 RepID=A0AAQ3T3F5_PASNO